MKHMEREPVTWEAFAVDDVQRPTRLHNDNLLLSIVLPLLDERENIFPIYQEITNCLPANLRWEAIFVDDGSRDGSWDEVIELRKTDPRVKGVRLSRKFGHQYALYAGLTRARGQVVVTMDADLQHPPEVILTLLDAWRSGAKVVHTVRRDAPNTSLFKRTASRAFYKIFSFLSGVPIEMGMADFRLLDRSVVESLLSLREEGLFLRGLVHWVGYPSARVEYSCRERLHGESSYTLRRMLQLGWDGITSFSLVPLRLGILVGVATSAIAFGEISYALYQKLALGTPVAGWTSAVSIISFLFGILFILLGVLGEYIGRVLVEVRGRPRFLVMDEMGTPQEANKDREGREIDRRS